METVAEADDSAGPETSDDAREPLQGRARVVGRQELAAARIMRTLLEMEIGDDQRPCVGLEQRPRGIGEQRRVRDRQARTHVVSRFLK